MIGYDTETGLMRRGRRVPPLVCLSVYGEGVVPAWVPPGARAVQVADGTWCRVLDHRQAVAAIPSLLRGTTVAHNAPFDLAVLAEHHRETTGTDLAMGLVVDGLATGRHMCTRVRERLIRLALGELEYSAQRDGYRPTSYSLAGLVARYFGADISAEKTDPRAWRLRYAELRDVPLADWPEDAVDYAGLDAWWAHKAAHAQTRAAPPEVDGYPLIVPHDAIVGDAPPRIVSEARETAAAWALWLESCWGIRTDPERVETTIAEWHAIVDAKRRRARELGWVRPDGSTARKLLQERIASAYGGNPPRTSPSKTFPEGQVQYSEEVLRDSGDPELEEYADSLAAAGYVSRWERPLRLGVRSPITYEVEHLLETGRASVADPPWQQPPREGGTRECVVPRSGYVLCSVDYNAIELCALAQVCLWIGVGSRLAEIVNGGQDPHLVTAAALLREQGRPLTYDEIKAAYKAADPQVVENRDAAKPLNFGLPGGMGPTGLRDYAKNSYGIRFTADQAEYLHGLWFQEYPEVRAYLSWAAAQLGPDGGTVRQFVSGRLRGRCRLTAAWNGYFQGLTADGAKYANWLLSCAAYTGSIPGHPELADAARAFHGSRPILFLHDEVLAELPADRAHEAGWAQARIMIAAMQPHLPDLKVSAEPALMARWYKRAKTVTDDQGRLALWSPTPKE